MFQRILVPIDPAKPLAAANDFAVDLAHKFGSQIVATYVIDEHILGPSAQQAATGLDEALEWVGTDALKGFCEVHPEISVDRRLAYGNSATAIFQTVLTTGADVVVLGGFHSGHPGVFGSIVGDIVHHCERSCFVVRKPHAPPQPGDHILVPYDGSAHPRATLPKIARYARAHEAIIDLVTIAKPKRQEKAMNLLKEAAAIVGEEGVAADTTVLTKRLFGNKGRTFMRHANATGAAMIAISRLGHSSLHSGRSRTVGWLISHADLPLLVVRR